MEKAVQGNRLKSFLIILMITPFVVLPFVLLSMKKKVFLTGLAPGSLKNQNGGVNLIGVLTGVASRESWFSGRDAVTIILFADGSVIVTQGEGQGVQIIAGASVPYWWAIKNYLVSHVSYYWHKSLGTGPQNMATQIGAYQTKQTNWVFIPEGKSLGPGLPDPFKVVLTSSLTKGTP